jgi:integrase/recombinase XerD
MFNKPIQSLVADSRNRNDGKLAIRIQLFYQNGNLKEQIYISLKLYYTPEEWAIINDHSNQRGVKSIINGDRLINERNKISFSQNRLTEIIDRYVKKGVLFSANDIKAEFLNKPVDSITRIYLMNLFDEIIAIKERTKKSHSTIESYKYAKKSFSKYIEDHLEKKTQTYRITSIDASWVHDYFSKMNSISDTTKHDYILLLRAVFNYAISEKLITEKLYPFKQNNIDNYFNIQTSAKTKRALTETEFNKLKTVRKLLTPAQQEAWDYFMLSYLFNGANLRDIANLKFSDIDKHDNTITFKRKKSSTSKKSDKEIVVVLSEQISRIIELRGNPEESRNYIFPIFSGNESDDIEKSIIVKYKTHSWGKKWELIAKTAGIRKDLTYQMARHTYATTADLNSIPIEEISKAMGHATIQQTKDYIATLPKNNTPENEKMKQKTVPLDIFN